jgi:hypothetical protein
VSVPVKRIKADYDAATMREFEVEGMKLSLEERPASAASPAADSQQQQDEVVYSFDHNQATAAPAAQPKAKAKAPTKKSHDPVASFWDDEELP